MASSFSTVRKVLRYWGFLEDYERRFVNNQKIFDYSIELHPDLEWLKEKKEKKEQEEKAFIEKLRGFDVEIRDRIYYHGTQQEITVIELRYKRHMNWVQIGVAMGIDESYARKIEKRICFENARWITEYWERKE